MQIIDVDSLDDLRDVERVLHSVWDAPGGHPPVTLDLLRAFQHLGGHVCAAVVEDVAVAASVAVPAGEPGVLYSILTGVAAEHAGQGIGRRIKLHQRSSAARLGYDHIRWTFDPLVRHNARFNLRTLGARVVGYEPDFFGPLTDAFNAGAPTDRLVVDWPITTGVLGLPVGPGPRVEVVETGPDDEPAVVTDHEHTWIRVPDDIVALRGSSRTEAARWTQTARTHLAPAARRQAVAGLSADGWFVLEGRTA
ncbi:hypothetical protein [Aeromicrobium sp. Sec7.5]|uniref:hypothetical protein n=1 Tax=Aeromicrobium sp. Sec7.5 TaxID=3121276 RepID=UPI002FE4A260